jgi:hypothetical protein
MSLSLSVLRGLLDDAAIFPPGNAPLARAVADHAAHLRSPYADAVGPLVVRASDLGAAGDVEVAVVTGLDEAHAAVSAAGARLRALEVALPARAEAAEVRSLASCGADVYVEVPRDDRRSAVIAELAATGLRAKLRTGGLEADLFPTIPELAAVVAALVQAGVPFKATAGLHHAVRHTDPVTGFEHHGFLNLLLATARAQAGRSLADVAAALASRDDGAVARAALLLPPQVRDAFRSFGTCSIREPLDDLAHLDLLPVAWKNRKDGAA